MPTPWDPRHRTRPQYVLATDVRAALRALGEVTGEAVDDADLDEYLHLLILDRGVLITPFHIGCPSEFSTEHGPAALRRHLCPPVARRATPGSGAHGDRPAADGRALAPPRPKTLT